MDPNLLYLVFPFDDIANEVVFVQNLNGYIYFFLWVVVDYLNGFLASYRT